MKVIAKLRCDNIENLQQQEEKSIRLSAVTTGSEENKSFSRWTPSASVSIIISNETDASEFFQAGKEYYLTFEEAK
ncbi:MAG: hypothetical protein NTX38_00990 [Methylobacter sp.]|nr:hypothetical protein [Methylobacter sp.]